MAKLLRAQDGLLLVLAGANDILEELGDPFGFPSFAYGQLYGWVPPRYRKQNLYAATSRSLKTGNIERTTKDGKPYFRLTGQGKKKLVRHFPILKWQKRRWDKIWRVVVFDIEEKDRQDRDFLRRKLYDLGFGMLQWSVFISPFDVVDDLREFLEAELPGEWVLVMETRRMFVSDEKALAEKIWPLQKVNEMYRKLLGDWEEGRELSGKKKEDLVKKLKSRYLNILFNDPLLPQELLPDDWQGGKVRELISDLTKRSTIV